MRIISIPASELASTPQGDCPSWCVEHELDEGVHFGADVTVKLAKYGPADRRKRTLRVSRCQDDESGEQVWLDLGGTLEAVTPEAWAALRAV